MEINQSRQLAFLACVMFSNKKTEKNNNMGGMLAEATLLAL